jgi:hypothetical protein
MSKAERDLRSRLTKLLHSEAIIRGSLAMRERTCGKSGCRCVTKGEKHAGLYLVVSEEGKQRQIFVPKAFEELVRQWVKSYAAARALLEEISKLHHAKLRKREK